MLTLRASRQDLLPGIGLLLVPVLALVASSPDVLAQSKPRAAPAPAAAQAPASSQPADATGKAPAATADIRGFRSARFGSTEEAVRAAILKDFQAGPDRIASEENYAEQTRVLTVKVPDLLQGGGAASVGYILGYKSKALIQVSVSWSKATDDGMTPERLFSNANVLRAHFLSSGYKPDTVASNVPVNNGLVVFRGNDVADRTTLLLLQGTMSAGSSNQQVLSPSSLALIYIADSKNPDVFKLAPGQF